MTLTSCILFWSFLNGVSPGVTNAVISVESNGNVFAKGKLDDTGLMQIRPKYTKFSQRQLFQSCTNVMVGTEILGKLKKDCKMCIDKIYVNGYNLGKTGAKKLKYPEKWRYYRKIAARLEE